LIDKPAGMTSHDVVSRARRAMKTRSIGHTGTLDPFATGLLILLTGRATRLARYVEQQSKTYLATARLGFATTTDDRTGEPIQPVSDVSAVRERNVAEALEAMTGLQRQTPPAYSAKKVGGTRSYHLARKGEAVALAPVEVTVHQVDLVQFAPPLVTFRARVSAGTYIRAMGRDLGERLGIGAHLEALRREAIGTIGVEDALLLADLVEGVPLQPLARVLGHLVPVELTGDELKDVGHGRPLRRNEGSADLVRLVWEDRVVAVARRDGEWLRPVVVLEGM
jgi:tRNA pseudouridine55 synthase